MMSPIHPDFRDLLECFNSSGVRYLLIGGYAVNFYGHHRNTKDIDLWIAISPENAQRVAGALRSFGFSPTSASPEVFLKRGVVHAFGREPLRVDILSTPSGVEFDSCWERRVQGDLDGVGVPVISLSDLLANKTASGRPRDVADTEELKRLAQPAKNKSKPRRLPVRRKKK
jgi:hypothetical protein